MALGSIKRKIKYLRTYGIRRSWNSYSSYFGGQIISGMSRRFQFLTLLPVEVRIECTTRCNLKCIMCRNQNSPAKPHRDMSLEEFERVIGQFPHLKRADMTGQGENLLSNDFFEMVRRLKSRSVSVTFYDNFTLVSPEIAKQIISSGIDSIVISHDGATRETYEKIRKGAKFDDVISNIKNLMDMKVQMQSKTPDLTFNFVVLKDNVHELPAMVKLASSLGIKFLTFTEGRRYSEMDKFPVDLVAPEERTRIFDETSKTAKSLDVSINFDHFSKTPIKKCSYPFRSCLVRSDGSIYPCCHNGFSDLPSFGNIYDQEFKEIWKSKYFVEVRRSILQGKVAPYCVGCVEYA